MPALNEFDVLANNLPLKDNLSKYLCVKTTTTAYDDLEFQIPNGLDKIMSRFGHSGWKDMKPLIVGIKCYTVGPPSAVFVRHSSRDGSNGTMFDSFIVNHDTWYTFKYPLLGNYHTVTRILMSEGITAYTLAILDVSTRVRHDNGMNELPPGYTTFDPYVYGPHNKAIVYEDENGNLINPSGSDNMFVIRAIKN